jgi:hypothetical protein
MSAISRMIHDSRHRMVMAALLLAGPFSHGAVVEVSQDQFSTGVANVISARQSFVALSDNPIVGAALYLIPQRFFPSNRYTALRVSLFMSDPDAQAVGAELAVGTGALIGVPSGPTPDTGFYNVFFTTPFEQAAGERYLLEIVPFIPGGEDAEAGSIALGYSMADLYPQGQMAGFQVPQGRDLAFRTLVEPIPEPGAALMGGIALVSLGGLRRHR